MGHGGQKEHQRRGSYENGEKHVGPLGRDPHREGEQGAGEQGSQGSHHQLKRGVGAGLKIIARKADDPHIQADAHEAETERRETALVGSLGRTGWGWWAWVDREPCDGDDGKWGQRTDHDA